MLKINTILRFVLLCAMCQLACKQTPTSLTDEGGQRSLSRPLPLTVGNRWVYLDSMTSISSFNGHSDTTSTATIDTVVIVDSSRYGGITYFVLRPIIYPVGVLGQNIVERNDSVYIFSGTNADGSPILNLAFITPPADGGIVASGEFSAQWRGLPITTPAGLFNGVAVYFRSGGLDSVYIVPNVGIIRRTTDEWDSHFVTRTINRSTLLNYFAH